MDFSYLERNIASVRARIKSTALEAGRAPEEITLLAAVKYASAEEINYLHQSLDVNEIGENRVQQLLEHWNTVERSPDLKWHFIGTLQTNKVKYIIDKVCMIQSVDSVKLADEINKQAKKHSLCMDVLVEVNSGKEENKSGIFIEESAELCKHILSLDHLSLKGFMMMAPKFDNGADYINCFSKNAEEMRRIWTSELKLEGDPLLSFGMSNSFEEAIQTGSGLVRIGSTIFLKS